MAIVVFKASAACGGPIVMTVTLPPCFSFNLRAASTAFSSKGLTTDGTPSRTRVLVSGLILTSVVSGTCLMQTTISMLLLGAFLDQRQADLVSLDLIGPFID